MVAPKTRTTSTGFAGFKWKEGIRAVLGHRQRVHSYISLSGLEGAPMHGAGCQRISEPGLSPRSLYAWHQAHKLVVTGKLNRCKWKTQTFLCNLVLLVSSTVLCNHFSIQKTDNQSKAKKYSPNSCHPYQHLAVRFCVFRAMLEMWKELHAAFKKIIPFWRDRRPFRSCNCETPTLISQIIWLKLWAKP